MPTSKSYILGFILSIFFTLIAFALVMKNLLTGNALIVTLLVFALVQAWIQLSFFLHFKEASVWNKVVFLSTIGVMVILLTGSIWIMNHLNYNHNMSDTEIMHQEMIYK